MSGCWFGACHEGVVPACQAVGMVGAGSFRPVAGTEPASRLLWRRSPSRAISSGRRGAESRSAKLYVAPSGSIVNATKRVWRPAVAPKQKLAHAWSGGYRRSDRALSLRPVSDGAPDWGDLFLRRRSIFLAGPGFWPGFRFCRPDFPPGGGSTWGHQHRRWPDGVSTWFNLAGVSSVELYKWRFQIDNA